MPTVILASPQVDQWQAFSDALATGFQADIITVRTAAAALETAQSRHPQLVVIDAELGGLATVELIRCLLGIDVMINTAVASAEGEAAFHEATEGLGILMKLPPLPASADAGRLIERLHDIGVQ